MMAEHLKKILESAIFAADEPLTIKRMMSLFDVAEAPAIEKIAQALESLTEDYSDRGLELKEVSSGFRFQVKQDYASWVSKLWDEKPAKYSRALMETLALMAYQQPITRSEIEDIRGVGVSSYIIKTLMEREWIRIVGHKDVPGRPALFATTKHFLDYFNLKSLDELPVLSELRDLDKIEFELGNAPATKAKVLHDLEDITQLHLDPANIHIINSTAAENSIDSQTKKKSVIDSSDVLTELELSEQSNGIEATES